MARSRAALRGGRLALLPALEKSKVSAKNRLSPPWAYRKNEVVRGGQGGKLNPSLQVFRSPSGRTFGPDGDFSRKRPRRAAPLPVGAARFVFQPRGAVTSARAPGSPIQRGSTCQTRAMVSALSA